VPVTLNCACGKSLQPKDEVADKSVKCPVCGAVVSVPKPDEFSDFEVVEDEPAAPAPRPPAKKAVVKAEVADEAPPAPQNQVAKPTTKKKKKKKKKTATAGEDDSYEQAVEAQERMARTARALAYVVVGVLLVAGVGYIYLNHWEDVKYTGGEAVFGVIVFGVFGLVAIGKGAIGLAFGQFLGDDD
jgi:hypothetical protein